MTPQRKSICDVPGLNVGHAQNDVAKTGCTVILPENGAVGGVDIRGSAPGTREIESLHPVRLVPKLNAILLTGGSAFGLDASSGVQQFLEEKGIGFDVGVTKIPIVPAAVIFDLREGDYRIRPDKEMGYAAASRAAKSHPEEGRVGAGRGATVGKILGQEYCMKGGIGTWSEKVGDITLGALVVVNALGDIFQPMTNTKLAGAVNPKTGKFYDTMQHLRKNPPKSFDPSTNTTLAVVATDAQLTKEQTIKLAQMAQDGLSRTIKPAHTPFDGDIVFALSVGDKDDVNITALGAIAAELVAESIVRAVKIANGMVKKSELNESSC